MQITAGTGAPPAWPAAKEAAVLSYPSAGAGFVWVWLGACETSSTATSFLPGSRVRGAGCSPAAGEGEQAAARACGGLHVPLAPAVIY